MQAHAERGLSSPEAQVNEAASHAVNTVTGRQVVPGEVVPGEVVRDQWRALTPDNIQHIAHQAMRPILLMAPPGVLMEPAGFEQAPVRSRRAVNGVACRSRGDTEARLVVGPDEVSVVRPDGPVTVRFAECAVLLAWPDGARRLIGADGMMITIEPTITRINASSRAQIDAGCQRRRS